MTIDKFLSKYHNYSATSQEECLREIESMEPVIDERHGVIDSVNIIPVEFPRLGWCLMVDSAYEEIKRLGIL